MKPIDIVLSLIILGILTATLIAAWRYHRGQQT